MTLKYNKLNHLNFEDVIHDKIFLDAGRRVSYDDLRKEIPTDREIITVDLANDVDLQKFCDECKFFIPEKP